MPDSETPESARPAFDLEAHPTIETARLTLRRLTAGDAESISTQAGDRHIAAMTLTIPHPYEVDVARAFITKLDQAFVEGRSVTFGIVRRADGEFVGMCGVEFVSEHERAEIGYWIGRSYWGQGFATEAARAVTDHAFRDRGCFRVHAQAYAVNPASRRVLENAGLTYEGCQKGHIVRLGTRQDLENFGILRPDWEARRVDR